MLGLLCFRKWNALEDSLDSIKNAGQRAVVGNAMVELYYKVTRIMKWKYNVKRLNLLSLSVCTYATFSAVLIVFCALYRPSMQIAICK